MASQAAAALSHFLAALVYIPVVVAAGVALHYAWKYYRPGEWERFKATVVWLVSKFVGILVKCFLFIYTNFFRLLVISLFAAYMALSYRFSFGSLEPKIFKTWPRTANAVWITLGIILALGSFNVLLKSNRKGEAPYPEGASIWGKTKWTLARSGLELKIAIVFAFLLALLALLAFLVSKNSVISAKIATIVMTLITVGFLVILYSFAKDNPTVRHFLARNKYIKILYQLIFLIPCGLTVGLDYLYHQFKETPRYVYYILAAEVVVTTLYIVIPILMKKFYTFQVEGDKRKLTTKQQFKGLDSAITELEKKIAKVKEGAGVNWKTILAQSLYMPANSGVLTDALTEEGFQKTGQKKTLLNTLFGKKLTLEAASTYVTTNGPLLLEWQAELDILLTRQRKLKEALKEDKGAFEGKILLDKAIYTDTETKIGTFENLKADIGDYNYGYAVSAWFFIHEQPPGARMANIKFTSLLNYADKPNILYNLKERKLQFRTMTEDRVEATVFETEDFPMQRWNNVVVNYVAGTLDIFINKKLVFSSPNIIPYMQAGVVTAGAKDGVSGGIANVSYFASPLSKQRIEANYDLLKNREFPNV